MLLSNRLRLPLTTGSHCGIKENVWHANQQSQENVIVQRQIASDISGVAFSLNPSNNCYDEIVISANFGLGESVVSGTVTPDTCTVDAVTRDIISKKIANKEFPIWLQGDGGTRQCEEQRYVCASINGRTDSASCIIGFHGGGVSGG